MKLRTVLPLHSIIKLVLVLVIRHTLVSSRGTPIRSLLVDHEFVMQKLITQIHLFELISVHWKLTNFPSSLEKTKVTVIWALTWFLVVRSSRVSSNRRQVLCKCCGVVHPRNKIFFKSNLYSIFPFRVSQIIGFVNRIT